MKKLWTMCLTALMGICLIAAPGCQQPDGGWDFNQVSPIIKSTTTMIAQFAFNDPRVAPHKEEICSAASTATDFLTNFDDPDATFEQLKTQVLAAISGIEGISPEAKQITLAVTEFVLDSSWLFVRDNYLDLINKDESQVVLLLAKSVAEGINNACGTGVTSFSADNQFTPLTGYLDKYGQ